MRTVRAITVLGLLAALSISASAWAPGTHAYIAGKLKPGVDPTNIMFGSVAADINQILSTDQNSPFFWATHYGFAGVWGAAQLMPGETPKVLAFGYVTHNEAWGADHYAHIQSRLYPRYRNPDPRYPGQNGYVWVKAAQLCAVMKGQLQAAGMAGGMSEVLLSDPMNCHFIVEYAMDLLLKATRDPKIGQKLLDAASNYDQTTLGALFMAGYPSPDIPYPPPLNTQPMGVGMAAYQGGWAMLIQMYADALNKPTMHEAVPAVSAFLEVLAERLLAAQLRAALNLGPDDPIPDAVKQQLTTLIHLGIVDSLMICSYDFNPELDLTIKSVRQNLATNEVEF
jgi:hypothetical protein